MEKMIPLFIADCNIGEYGLFFADCVECEKIRMCPGCFKLAPYVYDKNDQYQFLEYLEEVCPEEYYFQNESDFKNHLLECSNGFNIHSDSHIFEVIAPQQKNIVHNMGRFSQFEQKLGRPMTSESHFDLRDYRVFVSTYDFKKGDLYKKVPIGYVSVMKRFPEGKGKEILVVEDIYVFKRFRNKGVGLELIDHVIKEYNIEDDIGVQLEIAPEFESILKKRFNYIWGYYSLNIAGKISL